MAQFNIHSAKAHLSELIQTLLGEEVIITRGNKPMVELVAINPLKRQRQIEFAKGTLNIAPNFDKPLDDFENYR
jgi:antitoxin (DNA-binding transcriptional repressor) of toxin-antitoxin stability system